MIALALTSLTPPLAILDMLGGSELVVIFLLVLIFFGGEKMPEFARGLGKAIREFRKAASGVEQEFKRALEEDPAQTKTPPSTYPATPPNMPTILPPAAVQRPAGESTPAGNSAATPAVVPPPPPATPAPTEYHPDTPDEHHVG